MRCSHCFELMDIYGMSPAIDAFTGAPVCDPCVAERRNWRALSLFPDPVADGDEK